MKQRKDIYSGWSMRTKKLMDQVFNNSGTFLKRILLEIVIVCFVILRLVASWRKRWPHVCLSVCQWLDNGLDSAKIGSRRVSLLSSGAFNRKGREMVHCFLSLRYWERPWSFSLSLPLIMYQHTVYETIYVWSQLCSNNYTSTTQLRLSKALWLMWKNPLIVQYVSS